MQKTNFCHVVSSYILNQISKLNNHTNTSKKSNNFIILTLGNNDSDIEDYKTPTNKFLYELSNNLILYLPINLQKSSKTELQKSFQEGGYYSINLNRKLKLIALNINPLSSINSNYKLSLKQLGWLNNQLKTAEQNNEHIIIAQHIPYGVDAYKSVNPLFGTVMFFNNKLQQQYLQTLRKYAKNITTIYAEHLHSEYFSFIPSSNNQDTIPIIGTLAFNAKHNNPGFKIITINDYGSIINYTTYNTTLNNKNISWQKLYDLNTNYLGSITNNHLELNQQRYSLTNVLINFPYDLNNQQVINYRNYYDGEYYSQPIAEDKNWKYYYCAIKNINKITYKKCILQQKHKP